ncbi:recombinase family protein [Methylocystis sp. Sn-Cys]|uniref:recombinase family protein n=1 Tax=Methylocystis sp. Sn-Cys TaxID=1701263 RepID=UPI00192203BB|nr:recombinase family protein [Methylocystis sp. Sn-Cys]MBL1258621.1 recombinase family protein [Methylocystis sp. Sn-Cys]
MSRVFAYCRVSTADQTVENQAREIASAGFRIEPHRIISETVSGGVQASARPAFRSLLDRLEAGDVLIVTKLDRLGRNVIDVRQTVEGLAQRGIRVHCLALGGADLTSAAGKMVMGVLAAVAEFERDLLVERTQAGLARARAEGKTPGRPARFTDRQRAEIAKSLANGASVSKLAAEWGVDRRLIQRVKAAHVEG